MNEERKLVGGLVTVLTQDKPLRRSGFSSLAEWQPNFPPDRPNLKHLLVLVEDRISPYAQSRLDRLESADCPESSIELMKGCRAYFEFQDMLAGSVSGIDKKLNRPRVENHDYCYFESIVYLRESLMAWVQGNELAAITLLRPFMELSLLHLYWLLRCERKSFEPFFKWLDGEAGKPSFTDIRTFVMANLPTADYVDSARLESMSMFFKDIFDATSSYNHTPKIDESMFGMGGATGQSTEATSDHYVRTAEVLLRQLVHLYIFVFPMVVFPVDRLAKWGFGGGPVGLVADISTANIIHDFIGDNFEKLQTRFHDVSAVQDVRAWYESQPDMSPSEIEELWQGDKDLRHMVEDTKGHDARLAIMKAHNRSFAWSMGYANVRSAAAHSFREGVLSDLGSVSAE